MRRAVQLTIPKACHENWDSMTADEKGRYCQSCCKTVVDFTNMSDRAILQHFANAGGSRVCGRLHPDQLQRSMTIHRESRWPWLKYFFQFTLPAFLISVKARGQEAKRKTNDTVQVQATSNQMKGLSSHSANLTMRGRVVAQDGSGIAAAKVEVRGDSNSILTDQDGYFSINWPKDKNLVLFVSCIGCKPVRKKIKEMYRLANVVLQVKMSNAVMGEVIITY